MDKQTQDSQEHAKEKNRNLKDNDQAESTRESAGKEQITDQRQSGVEDKGEKKRKWIRSLPLLIAEICILLISVVVMYVVVTTTDEVEHKDIDREQIIINEEVKETHEKEEKQKISKGYRNIALFGVDARDGQLGRGTRSDSIIIASINQDTQEIKLVSVFRDTFLNLSNDTYNKCNAAYAQGGPEQAISMLNTNLDLDITDYVTVGFG